VTARRKFDQLAEVLRARITAGELRPGMLAPSGPELAKETGFNVLTCRKSLQLLCATGELTRVSRSGRYRVPGDGPTGDGRELAQALAERRHTIGLTQPELADAIGMNVTTVGHAETARLWQSRTFWQKVDQVLDADGDLVARFDRWRAGSPPVTARGALITPATDAAVENLLSSGSPVPVEPDTPEGVVITLPLDPVLVTVIWRDGSATTVQPGPS
jgi:DNA-binding transcriptional regulator YhcF (GntR family)